MRFFDFFAIILIKMPEKLGLSQMPLAEQTNQEKIDLSQFGLEKDSYLEKNLNGQDREKIKGVLSAISEQVSGFFGSNSPYVLKALFSSLNSHWVSRCQNPKDFQKYAEAIIDVAKSQIKYNEKGVAEENQYFDTEKIKITAFCVEDLAEKTGGNFEQSISTLRQMVKDSIEMGHPEADVVGNLWNLNHDGIAFSEESLRTIQRIVKNTAERKVIDLKQSGSKPLLKILFGDNYAKDTGKKDEKYNAIYEPDDTFKKWRDVSKGKFAFDESLGVIAQSFRYDADPVAFVDKFNEMTTEQQNIFVSNARKFMAKGIPPQVIADNPHLMNSWECDLSKKGLAIFIYPENKKWWLEYCANVWKYNPASIDLTKQFFNEVLSPQKIETITKKEWNVENIKGISQKELSEIQGNVDEELGAGEFKTVKEIQPDQQLKEHAAKILRKTLEELYADKDFDTICKIRDSINESAEFISNLDKENASVLTHNHTDLIKFITTLGSDKEKVLPLTFAKAQEMIFANLADNLDLADYFLENLPKYYKQPWVAENITKAVKHYSVAQKFISSVEHEDVIWKNEAWVANICTQVKAVVDEHQKQWDQNDDQEDTEYGNRHGNEGFSASDPYENDPWRFTTKQARLSTVVENVINGDTEAIKELQRLGFNLENDAHIFSEINNAITDAYMNFLEKIQINSKIKDDDKEVLLNPKDGVVKLDLLIDNVRSFIARYLVQKYEGDVRKMSSELANDGWLNEVVTDENDKDWSGNYPRGVALLHDIEHLVKEGFDKYIKVHEVEIPLYDKLYEEFDNLRETGRYPLEVFLGRDGIYAWVGRRSQDVARRRKLGLEGRKKLKEMGEVLEIHPQYTVYPRYFRDNLNYETKRKFLEQEGISPDADPLFYDTGYTGTIPEQIMKVMDFSDEEIEKRIKLLSAPSASRRVKGIAENARHEIIEYIEHNAKTEGTAEGLILDEKTGKIRHIAKPTSPEEQFNFMMVKQAISRHYWTQEKLHHEPSGNMNLDSEHYTIRIRQEYAKILPEDFVKDPKEFMANHGELLKGSRGEGQYPDEEIILFKMTDGTEIVAKKIELRKAKEARKEFSILISAKKAGLPTADPVGFISGKEEKDSSYLLMKKLEGVSGRNFDKHLRDSGKFTEDQVKSILKVVAEKNREMAELFRITLKIDKRWRIKDTIIEFNEETGEVGNVTPIDWERAQNFNPSTPKEIDEII